MKHITTSIVLLFLFVQSTQSQIIDSIYDVMNPRNRTFWNSVQSLISTEHRSCIAIADFGDVFKIDSLGHIAWHANIPFNEFRSIRVTGTYTSTVSEPKYFFFFSWYDECDTGNPYKFFKFDFEGNFIEESTNSSIQGYSTFYGGNFEFPPLPKLPKYLLSIGGKPTLYYSPDSTVLVSNISDGRAADINANGDFVLGTKDSIFIYKQEAGIFQKTSHVQYGNGDYQYWIRWISDSTLLHMENKKATIFNSSLDSITSYSISPGYKRNSATWHDPFLHLTIGNEVDTQIVILDKNLKIVFEIKSSLLGESLNDFIFYPDSTILISGNQYYSSGEGFNYFKTIDFSSTGGKNITDVSVVNWVSNGIHPKGEYGCMGYPEYESFRLDDVHVEIKNEGNVPLERAIITSHEPYCLFYCSPQYFYRDTFTDLHLLPGETRDIYLGDIQIERDKGIVPEPLCLGVILPDNHLDADKSNNFLCLQDPVGISTINEAKEFILYPNPTTDFIYFNWAIPKNAKWKILNSIGTMAMTGSAETTGIQQVDVSFLPPGMYFLEFKIEDGKTKSGKFVKR